MNRLNLFLIKLQASAASESVFKLCELPFDRFRCKIPQLIHPTNCLQMGLMFWSPWHICLDKKAKFWICKTSRYKPCRSWCALQSRFIAARFYREVSLAYCGFAGLHWTCDVCLTARRLFGRNTNDFDSIQTWWNIKPIWRTYIWQNWRNNKKKHPIPVILVYLAKIIPFLSFFCIGKLLPAASDSGQWPTKAQRFGRATGRWRWLFVEGVSREATVKKRTKKP